jgi:hypothetical protein
MKATLRWRTMGVEGGYSFLLELMARKLERSAVVGDGANRLRVPS